MVALLLRRSIAQNLSWLLAGLQPALQGAPGGLNFRFSLSQKR